VASVGERFLRKIGAFPFTHDTYYDKIILLFQEVIDCSASPTYVLSRGVVRDAANRCPGKLILNTVLAMAPE
jgi:hypothetical protein